MAKAKTYRMTQARSKALAEYRKQQTRVRSFMSRAEKRGYSFNIERPKTASQLKNVSTARIKKLTRELSQVKPNELYSHSVYLYYSPGKSKPMLVPGYKYRQKERSVAARRGVLTRERNKQERESVRNWQRENEQRQQQQQQYEQQTFEETQREKDEENKKRLEQDTSYRESFEKGQMIYRKVLDMISNARATQPKSADYLQSLLDEAISQYGSYSVMRNLEDYEGDILYYADIALRYRPNNNLNGNAMNILRSMLMGGEIPSAEEDAEWAKEQESDDYEDPLPFE